MKRKRHLLAGIGALLLLLLFACQSKTEVQNYHGSKPFEQLSDYRFFSGELSDLQPNEGVLPYDLNTPLFTDYAEKARFVWMPEGKTATYNDTATFDFPEGAVLIKNFFYYTDARDPSKGKRIIETRLLVKEKNKWAAHTYVWDAAQKDAQLQVAGGTASVDWTDEKGLPRHVNYVIPNKNQCKGCHNYDEVLIPIGPKARHLNKSYTYADEIANQLDKWVFTGYLQGYSEQSNTPKTAVWNDTSSGPLHDRAMAYLEMNCGHCHNEHGPANTSGLTLTIFEKDPTKIGVNKTPVAAGRGSGHLSFDIVPGHPEASILLYRMDSDDPGIMMPELGRTVIHTEGVALIRDWMRGMGE